jgi:hypothetical protein
VVRLLPSGKLSKGFAPLPSSVSSDSTLLFKKILLAYNSCTLWYLHMCLKYILARFTPSIILLPTLLRTISTGFVFLIAHMDTKHIHHIHPQSPFPCAHSPSTGTHSRKDVFSLLPVMFSAPYFCSFLSIPGPLP